MMVPQYPCLILLVMLTGYRMWLVRQFSTFSVITGSIAVCLATMMAFQVKSRPKLLMIVMIPFPKRRFEKLAVAPRFRQMIVQSSPWLYSGI